jgi:hypothetical protein
MRAEEAMSEAAESLSGRAQSHSRFPPSSETRLQGAAVYPLVEAQSD